MLTESGFPDIASHEDQERKRKKQEREDQERQRLNLFLRIFLPGLQLTDTINQQEEKPKTVEKPQEPKNVRTLEHIRNDIARFVPWAVIFGNTKTMEHT